VVSCDGVEQAADGEKMGPGSNVGCRSEGKGNIKIGCRSEGKSKVGSMDEGKGKIGCGDAGRRKVGYRSEGKGERSGAETMGGRRKRSERSWLRRVPTRVRV
jgi:hypothetical protein